MIWVLLVVLNGVPSTMRFETKSGCEQAQAWFRTNNAGMTIRATCVKDK